MFLVFDKQVKKQYQKNEKKKSMKQIFQIKFYQNLLTKNGQTDLKSSSNYLLEYDHLHKTFNDALNPLCSCCIEAETTKHCFLSYHFYNSNQATLINDLKKIPISFSTVSYKNLISLLSYGDDKFVDTKYQRILVSIIRFVKDSDWFVSNLRQK